MIKAGATVTATEPGYAWIETRRKSACGHCAAAQGCGVSVLGEALGARPTRLRVVDTLALSAGEHVVIGIPDRRLPAAAFRAYLAPLLWMVGTALAGAQLGFSQWAIGLCSFTALAAALFWSVTHSRVAEADMQPVLLRREHEREADLGLKEMCQTCGCLSGQVNKQVRRCLIKID